MSAGEEEADVALLIDPADEPVRRTLDEAMRREGWQVATGNEQAACAVAVWSARSIASPELAADARPFLDRRLLLQVLLQAEEWRLGAPGTIEPPEPFVNYQGLVAEPSELDGSERAVDWFSFRLSEGEEILAEVARLGGLPRPRDRWNARIEFLKPHRRIRDVRLVELAPEDGRVLRAWREFGRDPLIVPFETAIGNRWQMLDLSSGELLDEVQVNESELLVRLPERDPWWRRLRRG